MALEGTLRDFSLADIFQLIGIQKKTGILTLTSANDVVTVSFLNGSVVCADSQNKNLEDRLGNVLVKSGRISAENLDRALRLQRETRQRLGYLLVRGGHIKEADLREALRLQITQIVYRLFRWRDGEYHFSQEDNVEYDRENFAPLSAESVLMEGIRMIDEWPMIERRIKSFDMILRKTDPRRKAVVASRAPEEPGGLEAALSSREDAGATAPADIVRLTADETLIYDLVDGTLSVQEIVDSAHMGEFDACRILSDLLGRGLLSTTQTLAAPARPDHPSVNWGGIAGWAAYAALLLGLAITGYRMESRPWEGLPLDLVPAGTIERVRDLLARNRVERLDDAIQVYYLQKGFYPDDLKDLVTGRLVSDVTLKDPWGRSFGFLSTSSGYKIIAYDAGGAENPGRSVARGVVAESREGSVPAGDAGKRTASGRSATAQ